MKNVQSHVIRTSLLGRRNSFSHYDLRSNVEQTLFSCSAALGSGSAEPGSHQRTRCLCPNMRQLVALVSIYVTVYVSSQLLSTTDVNRAETFPCVSELS